MHKITTIFFDWGGVIADDPGNDFLRKLLLKIGASPEQVEEIYNSYMRQFMFGQISEAEYWQALRTNYNLSIHDSISEEFKHWNGLKRNLKIVSFIDELKIKGFQTAILSNVIEPTYNVLADAGYYDQFEHVIASFKVGYAKPMPEIYQLALERLGVTAEESLFVDDQQKNIVPADALGFKTVLANNPAQIIRDIKAAIS